MKEGCFKFIPEGEVRPTYHLINFEGETAEYGCTFEQATATAKEWNLIECSCNWQVVPDFI